MPEAALNGPALNDTASNDTAVDAAATPRRRWWFIDPGGSVVGLLLAILSITPSLLPRPALFQGVITAVAFGVGYMLGALVWAGIRALIARRSGQVPRPSPTLRRMLWVGYGVLWLAALVTLSALAVAWQNEVRVLVEMPPLDGAGIAAFLAGFVSVTLVLLAIGKATRRMFWALRRRSGLPVGLIGTATVVVAGLAALAVVVTTAIDSIYLERNGSPDAELIEPASTYRSAGADSAIGWDGLGRHGAAFVAGGPTASEISALIDAPALEPIRVYAGLDSADTMQARADLIVAELERTGGFERAVLVVATTTGSGGLSRKPSTPSNTCTRATPRSSRCSTPTRRAGCRLCLIPMRQSWRPECCLTQLKNAGCNCPQTIGRSSSLMGSASERTGAKPCLPISTTCGHALTARCLSAALAVRRCGRRCSQSGMPGALPGNRCSTAVAKCAGCRGWASSPSTACGSSRVCSTCSTQPTR